MDSRHTKKAIPEPFRRPGMPLGRHLHHDPKSRGYMVRQILDTEAPLVSKRWTRYTAPFDQGNLGSCTGNACLGMLATQPFRMPTGWKGIRYREATAVSLYGRATEIDEFGGFYPPEDTGSSTLGVLKAAQECGWIDNYVWGFSLDDALRTVSQKCPIIVGTNWYSSMYTPDSHGVVTVDGSVEGGHEYEILGIDVKRRRVEAENSWGLWGKRGRFYLSFDTLGRLLEEDGEAGCGVRNA